MRIRMRVCLCVHCCQHTHGGRKKKWKFEHLHSEAENSICSWRSQEMIANPRVPLNGASRSSVQLLAGCENLKKIHFLMKKKIKKQLQFDIHNIYVHNMFIQRDCTDSNATSVENLAAQRKLHPIIIYMHKIAYFFIFSEILK